MMDDRPAPMILIPTPGDHYSNGTGSAIISVLHEIVRKHVSAGGSATIIVGCDTVHDLPDGEIIKVRFTDYPSSQKKLLDTANGWMGFPRWNEQALYRPALDAIDQGFSGNLVLFNAPGAIPSFKKRLSRASVCLYAVNELFRTYSRREIERVVKEADQIVCCSQFIANDLHRRLGFQSPKVHVVHNGINTSCFYPPPSTVKAGVPTILFIGRMVPEKGPDLLLRAARLLHGKVPPFRVRLVGSKTFALSGDLSSYERNLRSIAAPIQNIVDFKPAISRDKLLEEYHSASVFCAPAVWNDPFPLVLLEAMASGLPTIASRRGGIPENGPGAMLYFNPPDVEELAERLAMLLSSEDTRAQWGAQARAHVEQFNWEAQYTKLQRVLRQNSDSCFSPNQNASI